MVKIIYFIFKDFFKNPSQRALIGFLQYGRLENQP